MDQDEVRVTDRQMIGCFVILLLVLMLAVKCGMWYEKFNTRFTWHEIPLKSGGIAFIVPEKWQVVPEWDKHGRAYEMPTDQ